MPSKNPWKTLKSKIAYKNPWFSVREDQVIKPNGQKGMYCVVQTHPSVFIVAMDEKDQVCLIRQWRYPTSINAWEIPGGGTDGEKPLKAAKRELWEETGYKAKKWTKLGTFQNISGLSNETSHAFLATDIYKAEEKKESDDHIYQVTKVPIKKVFKMIANGRLTDGQSIISLTQAALRIRFKI